MWRYATELLAQKQKFVEHNIFLCFLTKLAFKFLKQYFFIEFVTIVADIIFFYILLILVSWLYLFIKGAKSSNQAEVISAFVTTYIQIRSVLTWLQGAISSDVKQLEHNLTSTQFCLLPKARMHGALHLFIHVHFIKQWV